MAPEPHSEGGPGGWSETHVRVVQLAGAVGRAQTQRVFLAGDANMVDACGGGHWILPVCGCVWTAQGNCIWRWLFSEF
jgi:hypothetical protein